MRLPREEVKLPVLLKPLQLSVPSRRYSNRRWVRRTLTRRLLRELATLLCLAPPPGLPVALTCPENMTPAKVERYRSIIVNVSISVSIGGGGLLLAYFKVALTTLLCFTDG